MQKNTQQREGGNDQISNGMEPMNFNWIGLASFLKREYDRTIRVAGQVFVSPWVSAFLYIFIFGSILGQRIDLIGGVPYINFVFPGILMMNVIQGAFMSSSSVVYFARFLRSIEEMLVAPFSYLEMILAFTLSAIIRTIIIATGIMIIGLIFGAVYFSHPLTFFLVTFAVSGVFALLGMIVGLWSKGFEQLNMVPTFIIMPLSFLGGMFYSIDMLPASLQFVSHFNPFFYFVDLMRYSMIDHHDTSLVLSWSVVLVLLVLLLVLVWHLFKQGWRIRE
ncbi:MAG: ABC transporter permease [Patescibacteria group bacterium]